MEIEQIGASPRSTLFSGCEVYFDDQGPLSVAANSGYHAIALGGTQSLRLTPRISSFFANESLRFAALAAVSVAAWMALGPLLAAALINPNLWAVPLQQGDRLADQQQHAVRRRL
ncbi:hypothetical protein, partial [Pseudarthrobacter oxydans]|uniref:hypothetical protein n=1 Tax=Pseudarthrobacter oxydans TaxID=1671 RepID=UPI00343E2EA1